MHTLAGISATKTLEAVRKWTNQNPVYLLGSIINQLERREGGWDYIASVRIITITSYL
jgi:hypothetical protein